MSNKYCRLEEAEERYRNRESRPEDLERIRQLQEAIVQREQALKRMMVSASSDFNDIATMVLPLYLIAAEV